MALRALARRVLPERPGATPRAGVRVAGAAHHRDQRVVLLAADPGELCALARGRTRGLRLQRQGIALHHAHAPAARSGDAAREFLRFRAVQSARKARTDTLAVPAELSLRPGAA